MIGVTPKQKEVLNFVRAYIVGHDGVSPSFREIADAVRVHSKSGISRLVRGLEERGHLRTVPNRRRSLQLVEQISLRALPDDLRKRVLAYAARAGKDPDDVVRWCVARSLDALDKQGEAAAI